MDRRRFLTATTSAAASLLAGQPAAADKTGKIWTVAVIGDSKRGGYGHGIDTLWLPLTNASIIAVADPDPKGLKSAAAKLSAPASFSSYREMLAETRPDIVAIGPRHIDQHLDMCLAAAEHGARGIYMEKPFCRSPEEADRIIEACDASGTKLALAHRNRYHPVLPVCQRLIEEGALGRLLEVRSRGKEDGRGGALDMWVLGSHMFNLATYFLGPPVACSGALLQDGIPCAREHVIDGAEGIGPLAGNEARARFEMKSCIPLFFDSVQNAGVRETGFGLQFIGTEGVLDLRIDQEPLAHLRKGSPFNPRLQSQLWLPVTTGGIGEPEPIPNLGRHVMHHTAGALDLFEAITDNRAPLCDAQAGRETIEMICAVCESHRLGGARVTFPLATRVNPLTLL
jgi:predicted dehydrogenase